MLGLSPGDRVIEIGAGGGVLTRIIAELPVRLVAVEIDPEFASGLTESLRAARNVSVRNADILEFDFGVLGCEREWKVVGNLPYNMVSPILARVFERSGAFSTGVFMVQREVADRLVARIGSRDYSSLTVFARTYCDTRRAFLLRPGSFFPAPRVNSAVLTMAFRSPLLTDSDSRRRFHRFVQGIFSHRRKTIFNCLMLVSALGRDAVSAILDKAGIDPSMRPQHLSLHQFTALFEAANGVMHA